MISIFDLLFFFFDLVLPFFDIHFPHPVLEAALHIIKLVLFPMINGFLYQSCFMLFRSNILLPSLKSSGLSCIVKACESIGQTPLGLFNSLLLHLLYFTLLSLLNLGDLSYLLIQLSYLLSNLILMVLEISLMAQLALFLPPPNCPLL